MHVTWTITGDGLLAFIGGALALLGVWWSNNQSVKNLQQRLDREKQAREDVRVARIKSLAAALKAEIEDFVMYHLEPILTSSQGEKRQAEREAVPQVKLLDPSPFAVYQASAGSIGEFNGATVRSIVRFHNLAGEYRAALRRYLELEEGRPIEGESLEERDKRLSSFFKERLFKPLCRLQELALAAIKDLDASIGPPTQN
jgi:hypothetical protein